MGVGCGGMGLEFFDFFVEFFESAFEFELVIGQGADMVCHEFRLFVKRVVVVFEGLFARL